MLKKYIKKPVVIEAVEFDGTNHNEVRSFMGEETYIQTMSGELPLGRELEITMLEGIMTATPGDFIIKGVKGEFYPCKPDIFKMTYDDNDNSLLYSLPYVVVPFDDVVCHSCHHNLCFLDAKTEGRFIPRYCANCGKEINWTDFKGFY